MPVFTPPTEYQKSDDPLFGRFNGTETGLSVVKVDGVFITQPYPWLGEIAGLTEGVDWFQGGRRYWVTGAVASDLAAAGYALDATTPAYGEGLFGGNNYGG